MDINKYKSYLQNLEITPEVITAVLTTLKEKDLSWPKGVTKRFEIAIEKYINVKHALAHCNGTSAMYSAMYSIGIQPGSEIICPTYTFWASIAPAINLGAKVVFCDIDSKDLLIKIEDLEKHITPLTKAIVVPHLWGRLADIESIKSICNKFEQKIYIIEDASHCFGASVKNENLGTLGDISIYSLQAGKPLVAGEGGLLVTNNSNLYESAVFLGHYERIKDLESTKYLKYQKTGGGYKFRIHPLAAALALSQLETIENKLCHHNKLMDYFESELSKIEGVKIPSVKNIDFKYGGRFGFRILVPNLKNREGFVNECNQSGLCVENEYIPLLHLEPFFSDNHAQNTGVGTFTNTETLHKQLVSLPIFYKGDTSIIDSYISEFNLILSKYL